MSGFGIILNTVFVGLYLYFVYKIAPEFQKAFNIKNTFGAYALTFLGLPVVWYMTTQQEPGVQVHKIVL